MISSKERLHGLAFIAYILSCLVLGTESQQLSGNFIPNPCVIKATCHECIQTLDCAWCSDSNHGDKHRCFVQYNNSNSCDPRYIHNPQTSLKLLVARELSRAGGQYSGDSSYYANPSYSSSSSSESYSSSGGYGSSGEIVQISPQRVSLQLRINELHNLQFRYSQAEDYPVDLYYLMDLSKSMEDDKEKLSALGDMLAETMRNITSNFRLGFGSFGLTIPNQLEHPCEGCEAPYGYRNHMSLSTDTSTFTTEVKRAVEQWNEGNKIKGEAVSSKLDAPEGGFNAIMQAIECRGQIGWRQEARRLLVFSTDAGFHILAGDGKLNGIIAPNDGQCHLNSEGLYTHSALQDYPSISQINHKVKQNMINVIFAVTANQRTVYDELSNHIEGSSIAELSNDSSNVVELVREEYSKISSSITMRDNSSSHIKITYHSKCLNGIEIETSKCDGLKVGDIVSFTAKILVTSCPADPAEWKQVIQIYPIGINEALFIDLEMLCGCDCEMPGYAGYQIKSPQCNNYGTLMCGICDCDDMHFGQSCEYSATDIQSDQMYDFDCRADNTSLVDCSGRGSCLYGVCECEKRINMDEVISGKFCECDNFSCDRYNQQICSGSDHGSCECGVCMCKPGWSDSACNCNTSIESCMPPDGGEICSGRGECVCGKCECKLAEEGRYSGYHCEHCPTCAGRCHELKDCTQCQVYRTGPLKNMEDCRTYCTGFSHYEVDKVEIEENKGEYLCIFYDEDDCKFKFKYREQDKKIIVVAQTKRECSFTLFGNLFRTK